MSPSDANIPTSANYQAKLADFGVAAILEPGRGAKSERAAGSPYWMAPEVITP